MAPIAAEQRSTGLVAGGGERSYGSRTGFIGEVGLVAVSGDVDLYAAPLFRQDLDRAVAVTPGDLILDLSDLGLIDSTALCVMLGALRRLRDQGRQLILVVTRSYVLRILTIAGLENALPIVASRHEAIQLAVRRTAVSPLGGVA
jgi:anti-sigma B factor antagonist